MPRAWEYAVVLVEMQRSSDGPDLLRLELSAYGASGYEVVSVLPQPDGKTLWVIFKKPTAN